MLHGVNGQTVIASLESTELPGEHIAWDDPLHEGPVRAGVDLDELNECPRTIHRRMWMGDVRRSAGPAGRS